MRDPVNPRQWRQAYVHGKFGDAADGTILPKGLTCAPAALTAAHMHGGSKVKRSMISVFI
jgi:hypothetical protein